MKFLALDPAVRDRFATNVNVVAVPIGAGIDFATYRRALIGELRTIVGSGRIDERVVSIGGTRALRLGYSFALTVGRRFTVRTLQYAFLRGRRSVVVTYTTLPKHAGRYAAVFERSAQSIRFPR